MTGVLLDTQVLLWWLADDPRLGRQARRTMATRPLLVSVASLWEIAIKVGLGKLEADIAEITRAMDADAMTRLPISDAHLAAYQALPRREDHRNPFDRMLVVQAMSETTPLLTADAKMGAYGLALADATV